MFYYRFSGAVIIFGFVILLISSFYRQQMDAISDSARITYTTELLINLHVQIFIFLIAILPIFTSDTIARDRTYGVTELINSAPIRNTEYLIGKILSSMMSCSLIAILLYLLLGILWWNLVHEFEVGLLVSQVWLPLFPIALIQPRLSFSIFND